LNHVCDYNRQDLSIVDKPPPSVSVVLATHNGVAFIGEQLASIADQSRLPDELIVGDDGSTDGTVAVLEELGRTCPFPVRITARSRRIGYADNFLAVARSASGSILVFCDQDDRWYPNRIERVVAAFADAPQAVLVACHADVVDRVGRPLDRTFPRTGITGRYPAGSLPLPHFPGFCLAVRAELLKVADADLRPDSGDARAGLMSHDIWLWMLAACTGESVILADRLIAYRQHDNLYGDLHVRLGESLRRSWQAAAETYVAQSASEEVIIDYLEGLSDSWQPGHIDWAAHAMRRASMHRSVSQRAAQRGQLYSSPTRAAALVRWARMVRSGAYGLPKRRRSSLVSILKDGLWATVRPRPTAPKVRRPSP